MLSTNLELDILTVNELTSDNLSFITHAEEVHRSDTNKNTIFMHTFNPNKKSNN